MNEYIKDMSEQLDRIFSKNTQLFNQARRDSPMQVQVGEIMDGIVKLNKSKDRMKAENYIKRGERFIDLTKAIDRSLNGEEALKSHYYKQPLSDTKPAAPSEQLAIEDVNEATEIKVEKSPFKRSDLKNMLVGIVKISSKRAKTDERYAPLEKEATEIANHFDRYSDSVLEKRVNALDAKLSQLEEADRIEQEQQQPEPEPEQPKRRGGARIGAGRKWTGLQRRVVSLSLRPEHWLAIDFLKIETGKEPPELIRTILSSVLDRLNELAGTEQYEPSLDEFDYITCPVCGGEDRPEPCFGCNGEKMLKQVKISLR